MIEKLDLTRGLFFDIETVSASPSWEELDAEFQELWAIKAKSISRSDEPLSEEECGQWYQDRAAIYSEFGRVVCISAGFLFRKDPESEWQARLTSFAGEDEREVLEQFGHLLNKSYSDTRASFICGHNIKEFDVPYLCRRYVCHGMELPIPFRIQGKKPWETEHLVDTLELWKFGDRKNYTSLRLLSALLDFPSPKDEMDGSQVGRVFWETKDVDRIAHYCEKDVLATIQLMMRYRRLPLIEEGAYEHVKS